MISQMIKRTLLLFAFFNFSVVHGASDFYFFWPPNLADQITTGPNVVGTNFVIDANGEQVMTVFSAPKTGNVVKIHWRTGTVTTGATIQVKFTTLFATGGVANTNTLWAINTTVNHVIDNGQDNMMIVSTLTASAPFVAGDTVCVVIANGTGGNMQIANFADDANNVPYGGLLTTTWTKGIFSAILALEYDDGSFYWIPGIFPSKDVTANSYAENSLLDERGIWMQLPFWGRCIGVRVWADMDADAYINLYGSDGVTKLARKGTDTDVRGLTSAHMHSYFWDTPVNLQPGVKYRVVVEPVQTATNLTTYDYVFSSPTARGSGPGGLLVGSTHAKNPSGNSSWVDTSTMSAPMELIFDKIYTDRGTTY